MNTEDAIASRPDEVVFENRNRAYGAYSIRRSYLPNLSKGSGGGMLFFGLLIAATQLALIVNPRLIKVVVDPPFTGTLMPVPEILRDSPPQRQIQTTPTANTKLPPRVVSVPAVDEPLAKPQESSTGQMDDVGEASSLSIGVVDTRELAAPAVAKAPQTIDFAEVMPEFEGGAKALYKFLKKTLRYPKAAERVGQEGIVYVRFVIDITGTVTGVEVIRGVSGVLDTEASRVISIMPRWKPGSQHGEPVNVRMVLPIKFQINPE